jgi:histidyl-tRNA synthetase
VRGLDYSTHTAFEFWHSSLQGAQNALGGGGRYDGLAEVLGFPDTPGIGYAFGVERLLITAGDYGKVPPPQPLCDAVVCSIEAEQVQQAAAAARRLRDAGIRTVLDAGDRKLDRKLRSAAKLGARACVLIGGDEAREKAATVRDMLTREQQRVSLDQLAATVTTVLAAQKGPAEPRA